MNWKKILSHPVSMALYAMFFSILIAIILSDKKIWELDSKEYLLGLMFSLIVYAVALSNEIKSFIVYYLDEKTKHLALVKEPPKRVNAATIREFMSLIKEADLFYSIDRSSPDLWYLEEEFLLFLGIQSHFVNKKSLAAHRFFIWQYDLYNDEKYKKLLVLNLCMGIRIYLLPLEIITGTKKVIDKKGKNNRFYNLLINYIKEQSWKEETKNKLQELFHKQWTWIAQDMEAIITKTNEKIEGIEKKRNNTNEIMHESLNDEQAHLYYVLFNYVINIGSYELKIDEIEEKARIGNNLLQNVENKINSLLNNLG